jgi:TolA-binding protein
MLQRASETLTALAEGGGPVSIAALATRAGVSRSWIYTQPELRDRIEQLQQSSSRIRRRTDGVHRASDKSLRRRLDLAHQRITQLSKENQQLREALAHAHGQLRAAATRS